MGDHNFRVRAIDPAGNVGAPARYDFAVSDDQTPPETTLLTTPPAQTNEDFASFTFESNDPTATFECNLDGAGFEECFNPGQFIELEPGTHTFEVRAVDLSLNPDPTPATYTWLYELDNEAPETTIHTFPPNPSLVPNATFTFGAVGPEITYECQLDNGNWEECEAPMLYELLTGGEHTFRVRATDFYGNVEQTPATYTWVQAVNPDVTLLTTPEDPSEVNAQTFTFSSNQSPVTFECRLTGAQSSNGFQPCTSPHAYTNLLDGDYIFEVRSKNQYGLVSEIPGLFEWTVAVPPQTTIHNKPTNPSTSTSAAFTFSSSEPNGALWECTLDGQSVDCLSSPFVAVNLAVGSHTFEVAAIDAMDNIDPTPATYTWVIDTLPETTLGNTPPASTPSTSASFTFSSNESNVSYECSLDGAAWAACSAPVNLSGLSIASHTFQVRAKDSPRNQLDPTPASFTWNVVDGTAPNTSITSVQTGSISFSFTGSDNHSPTGALTFQCRLDGAAFAACTSPKTYADPGAGSHTFEVRAVDQAGNVDGSPAEPHVEHRRQRRAEHVDLEPADEPELERVRELPVHRHRQLQRDREPHVPVPHRQLGSGRLGDVHEPEGVRRPLRRLAHLRGPRGRPGREPGRHPGDLHLDDPARRHDPAGHGHRPEAAADDDGHERVVRLLRDGDRLDVPVQARHGQPGPRAPRRRPTPRSPSAQHTFQVRATDAAQNQDPSEATYTWTVQNPAPPANCGSQVIAHRQRRRLDRPGQHEREQGRRLDPQGHVQERRQPPRPRAVPDADRCPPAARSTARRCACTPAPTRTAGRSRPSGSTTPGARAA